MSLSTQHPDIPDLYPSWVHRDVVYWRDTWAKIRDCVLGEQEIKDKGETYLPKMEDMSTAEYDNYRERAVFYNMTGRTVEALTGTVFQRRYKLTNVPQRLAANLERCTHTGTSLRAFLVEGAEALVQMGRFGLLVDRDKDGKAPPFLRGYETENILDWQVDTIEGRETLTCVILREFREKPRWRIGERREIEVITRVLSLDEEPDGSLVYRQYVYLSNGVHADLSKQDCEVIEPMRRGRTLDRIPFRFLGAKTNTPNIDRPPMADIVSLNIAHYRSYAHLEHGRYYTAMPIWYIQVNPSGQVRPEYTLGSSVVWEVLPGETPGLIEFNGNGLRFMESSLKDKEQQIAMIGGRFVAGASRSTAESSEQSKINEGNERSVLLKIVNNINEAYSDALNIWAWWQDEENAAIELELNTAFLFDQLGARELRAAHAMYKEGIIPIDALYEYLIKAEVVPDWMELEEFRASLDLVEQFPNQPDVWARMAGFNSARDREQLELDKRELDIEEQDNKADQSIERAKLRLDQVAKPQPLREPTQVTIGRRVTGTPPGGAPQP